MCFWFLNHYVSIFNLCSELSGCSMIEVAFSAVVEAHIWSDPPVNNENKLMKDYFMNLLFNRSISLNKEKQKQKIHQMLFVSICTCYSLWQTQYQNTRLDIYIGAILGPFHYKNKQKNTTEILISWQEAKTKTHIYTFLFLSKLKHTAMYTGEAVYSAGKRSKDKNHPPVDISHLFLEVRTKPAFVWLFSLQN